MVSRLEISKTKAIVTALYRELRHIAQNRWTILNPMSKMEMLEQPHQTQVAWLEQMKYLYEDAYIEIARTAVGNCPSTGEAELSWMRLTGQSNWE